MEGEVCAPYLQVLAMPLTGSSHYLASLHADCKVQRIIPQLLLLYDSRLPTSNKTVMALANNDDRKLKQVRAAMLFRAATTLNSE